MEKGLKPFGIEAVEYMNELGIIVDVSHLSDGGFYDVARVSKKLLLLLIPMQEPYLPIREI